MTHTEEFITREYEMDNNGYLRPQVLCNYMEESAGVHAAALGVGVDAFMEQGRTWVLAKLRLELHSLPHGHEQVHIKTWPVSIERAQFRRDFQLLDTTGKILASAISQWIIININSRRIERMPEALTHLQPENPPLAIENADIRIPALPAPLFNPPANAVSTPQFPVFPVRLADIDRNKHVNNNRYIDFILEAANNFGASEKLVGFDMIFRSEGLRGDIIGSATCAEEIDGENIFAETPKTHSLAHSLYRLKDGQELVRARTVWRG